MAELRMYIERRGKRLHSLNIITVPRTGKGGTMEELIDISDVALEAISEQIKNGNTSGRYDEQQEDGSFILNAWKFECNTWKED